MFNIKEIIILGSFEVDLYCYVKVVSLGLHCRYSRIEIWPIRVHLEPEKSSRLARGRSKSAWEYTSQNFKGIYRQKRCTKLLV